MIYFWCEKELLSIKTILSINNFSDLVDIQNDNNYFLIHYPENIDYIHMHIRSIIRKHKYDTTLFEL